jgi:UDP-glucuronate 4-epimerase
MTLLITGTAGFIGYHLVKYLVQNQPDWHVIGLDNINDYYSVQLKLDRLADTGIRPKKIEYNTLIQSPTHPNYRFIKLNLEDQPNLEQLFRDHSFDIVVNLAAQAGVRYSLTHPHTYINSNLVGFSQLIELAKNHNINHFIYASSSSVYGNNPQVPYSTSDRVDHPVSLYAATKRANELIAHTYSYNFQLPTTGLRFFTVYGPWGRPDMAYFKFTQRIFNHQPISIYNHGDLSRDMTYIDDIITGLHAVITTPPPKPKSNKSKNNNPQGLPRNVETNNLETAKIYNLGHSSPINLMDFITTLEQQLGIEAQKVYLPMQPGDVHQTYADMADFQRDFNYHPQTNLETGLNRFVTWYRSCYTSDIKKTKSNK